MSAISLTVVKAYLNIAGDAHDAKLQGIIDAAEAKISERIALAPTEVTRKIVPTGGSLVLPILPVLELTSVTPDIGTAIDVSLLEENHGVVTYVGQFTSLPRGGFPARWYTVVYQAGYPLDDDKVMLPANLALAIKELVRHLWAPQRGGVRRPGAAPSEATATTVPGAAFLMPFRVQELLNDFELPGIG